MDQKLRVTTRVDAEPLAVTAHVNPEQCRFEAYRDGAVAGFIRYEMRDGQICFTLTELTRDFRNYRFAAALIRSVLHDAQQRHLEVLPFCPLVRYFIATHFEYLPLVPIDRRRQFNLSHPDDVKPPRPQPDTTHRKPDRVNAGTTHRSIS